MPRIDNLTRPTPGSPLILAYPFRPFFLLAGVHAVVLMVAWMGTWFLGWPLSGELSPVRWHAHEMLFGLVPAAVAGFLLTAMCNWTGAAPLAGRELAALVGLWLAGRLAMWTSGWLPGWATMTIDGAFLPVLALYAGRVIVRAGSWRNLVLVGALAVLTAASLISHAGLLWHNPGLAVAGERLALFVIVLLMVVIGGRITPAFTRNWLMNNGGDRTRVRSWPVVEHLAFGSTVALVVALLLPVAPVVVAALAGIAGLTNAVRLAGWSGWLGRSEPLIWVLHLGYAWVVIGLLLKGATLFTGAIPDSAWLHALGVGAMGTLILGVMTRVSLGHTGRPLRLPPGAWMIYVTITIAATLRLASSLGWLDGRWPLWLASTAWCLAFAQFLVQYWPILTTPRADGRPG